MEKGTRIGPYEIAYEIGAGGMGEVWRARDTRLNREVAIKVLPGSLADDEDRLRRFEQEAFATSALNHPNILTVYDIGNHDGSPYIVSELLEGEELRDQLNHGAIAPRAVIDYATQIAGGLAAAHGKAIIHRDLKPENIFITTDGRVKILDFGLAKLRPQSSTPGSRSDIQTQRAITDPGVVMGTIGYMSPEQVRGQNADHRADIFSLGVILYEMLSGKRAFSGDSAADVMSAILKEDPPEFSETNTKINPALEKIIRRCLEKKPERRFHSAHDLGFALEAVSTQSGSRLDTTALPALTGHVNRGPSRERLAWVLMTLLLIVVLALLPPAIGHLRELRAAEAPMMRFSISPPAESSFDQFAVSPDGQWLAFSAATGAKVQLWVRALASLEAKALANTEGARLPFWSPDSRFIAFFAGGKLKRVDVSGGPAQPICDVRQGGGGSWNREGVIVFAESTRGIFRVSSSGDALTQVTVPDTERQEITHYNPCFLPDGRRFIYYVSSSQKDTRGIYLGSLDGRLKHRLLGDDSTAEYAASGNGRQRGYLLFVREGSLVAQPFDGDKGQLIGDPVPVAEHVSKGMLIYTRGDFSVSDNGVLIFDSNVNRQTSQLLWVNRAGKQTGSAGVAGSRPWLSPDEKRFVTDRYSPQTGLFSLWMADVSGANPAPFTFSQGSDLHPIWSPDGTRIVWYSNRDGVANLYQKAASGAGQEELLLKSDYFKVPEDWSRDGHFIIYQQIDPKTKFDLWVLPVGGTKQPFPFLQTPADEGGARLSPDGRWLVYVSDETGRYEVYAQRFPEGGSKRQISTAGGIGPVWRRDGKELFYHAAGGKVMAMPVQSGSSFDVGSPVALFEFRSGNTAGLQTIPSYTVSGDGQRFLINALVETQASTTLTVVLNWMAGVKKWQ